MDTTTLCNSLTRHSSTTAARGHPLHLPGIECAAFIAVIDGAVKDECHGFKTTRMWVRTAERSVGALVPSHFPVSTIEWNRAARGLGYLLVAKGRSVFRNPSRALNP